MLYHHISIESHTNDIHESPYQKPRKEKESVTRHARVPIVHQVVSSIVVFPIVESFIQSCMFRFMFVSFFVHASPPLQRRPGQRWFHLFFVVWYYHAVHHLTGSVSARRRPLWGYPSVSSGWNLRCLRVVKSCGTIVSANASTTPRAAMTTTHQSKSGSAIVVSASALRSTTRNDPNLLRPS